MNEREYDDLMRKALRSRPMWDELTASESDAQQAFDWLCAAKTKVTAALGQRKLDWVTVAASVPQSTKQYKHELVEYNTWRKRALGFLAVVDEHLQELRSGLRQSQIDRAFTEKQSLRESVLVLAKAIAAHEAHVGTNGDLYATLDQVKLPHGLAGELPLRDLLHRLGALA